MTIALDLIVILIIVFTVIGAAKKGFISAVFDFLKFIVAVIIAWSLKGVLSVYIMGTKIFSGVKESVTGTVMQAFENAGENLSASDMLSAVAEENPMALKVMESFGISPDMIEEWVQGAAAESTESAASYIAQNIIEPAAKICSEVIAFIVIFIVASIALWICQKILSKIFELPVLKQFNTVGGIIIGVVCAFLYVSLFVSIASALITNANLFGVELPADTISKTYVFKFFSENNLFSFVGSLFGSGSANV